MIFWLKYNRVFKNHNDSSISSRVARERERERERERDKNKKFVENNKRRKSKN